MIHISIKDLLTSSRYIMIDYIILAGVSTPKNTENTEVYTYPISDCVSESPKRAKKSFNRSG